MNNVNSHAEMISSAAAEAHTHTHCYTTTLCCGTIQSYLHEMFVCHATGLIPESPPVTDAEVMKQQQSDERRKWCWLVGWW